MQAHTKQETGIQSLLWSPYHHEANLSLWYIPGNDLISPLLLDQPRNTGKKWKRLLDSLRKSLKTANTDLTQRLKANAMIRGENNNNKAATLHVHDTCITICYFRNEKVTGAEMPPAIISGIVAGNAPVSDWPIFFPVSSNSPWSLCES